ncbi:uncharacterized protein [Phyllobates terribilis]|uniref:uncharacterized protein n=1 Tax=Phyllobates terribilis TaxID=111132 RepID=UPI003CCB02B3
MVILPSTVTGSPQHMHEYTQDAMTYVRKYGRPDLFITFTCNPAWEEIGGHLLPGQKTVNRHDLIAWVFKQKLSKMTNLITKSHIYGETQCWMYSVEWQKRGLPHAHILIWLKQKIQLIEIDNIISAELPGPYINPLLFDTITKNMIHGPCGSLNKNSPCMIDGRCSKHYPRSLVQETQTGKDGHPVYRRRKPGDGGFIAKLKMLVGSSLQEMEIDNRWVVPYNPLLSKIFQTHINVESCHSVKSIKYICKYVHKGSDQAVFELQKNGPIIDEVEAFQMDRKTLEQRKRGLDIEGYPGVKATDTLGRVYTVHPSNAECFYLRMLLHVVKGPTSFSDLKTVGGHVCETFREACQRKGLLKNDGHWDMTLSEAAASQTPKRLRHLFAIILTTCSISNPLEIWTKLDKTDLS